MADLDKSLITLGGLKVFKDNYDPEIDQKIADAGKGVTYTLTKNDDGEIVLTGSDESETKVSDENTTYDFTQSGTTLTITGTDGTSKTINLGQEITADAITTALGFTPLANNATAVAATKATQDANGNVITDTYMKKNFIVDSTSEPTDQEIGGLWDKSYE